MPYPGPSQTPLPWASVSSLVKGRNLLCRFLLPDCCKLRDCKSTGLPLESKSKSHTSLLEPAVPIPRWDLPSSTPSHCPLALPRGSSAFILEPVSYP